ncbi:hypothetical protein WOC76_12665 [Methylocystis sp. IM3]|uniref:hypothetical protein n=1 Tax=unclassified Methylocystis TaxID=2625913 RepID=UPI0030F95D8D
MTPFLKARLGKLIPLLGSDKDGEVLATARAIVTALASEGADLHDLAASVNPNASSRIKPTRRAFSVPPAFDSLTHFERRAWLDVLIDAEWLTPFERDTVEEVRNRVRLGQCYDPHWRKKRRIDELLARAAAKGVRA